MGSISTGKGGQFKSATRDQFQPVDMVNFDNPKGGNLDRFIHTAEIVVFFYTEFLRRECRRSLLENRMLTLSDRHAVLCRLTQSEYIEIKAIFTQLNEEIIQELKVQK